MKQLSLQDKMEKPEGNPLEKQVLRWRRLFFIMLSLFFALLFLFGYVIYHAYFNVPYLSDLTPFDLAGHQRLLILAPHCDDETLGAAGLILAARRAGIEVKVVIATNGDGYLFSTMEEFKRVYPNAQDFVRMGDLRQQESLEALQVLGVNPSQVIFLSYPDRGIASLWNEYWLRTHPYRSPYSDAASSPYRITYHPQSVYAGEDFLADVVSILAAYHPDLVVYPHPEDLHLDHWGLAAFTRLAAAVLEREDSEYHPELYAYLVHRRDYPEPKGYFPGQSLLPPRRSYAIDTNWFRQDLSRQDVALKSQAVDQYESQLTTLGYLLDSFVRVNETFAKPKPGFLPAIVKGDADDPGTWRDNLDRPVEPIQLDAGRDYITREMIPGADLRMFYAARDQDNRLLCCVRVQGVVENILFYHLQVVGIGAQQVVHHQAGNHALQTGWHALGLHGAYFCDQVELAALGDPWALFLGAYAEEVGAGTLDQIAWQLVYLEQPEPPVLVP